MIRGFFITIEGGEGSGKSTQSALLAEFLKKKGLRTVRTREPGGSRLSEALRGILLDPRNDISPLAELLLYEASRAQHVAEVISPALKAGAIVICDRFSDATLAYQGYGRGIDRRVITQLNTIASQGIHIDLTIFLDFDAALGLRKARTMHKESFAATDRIEREKTAFHEKVRRGYRDIARRDPHRVKIVPTAPSVNETHQYIVEAVEKMLRRNHVL